MTPGHHQVSAASTISNLILRLNRAELENARLKHEVMALGQAVEYFKNLAQWRGAVIEDDSITSAEDLSQRMQCAQPVTPADLDSAIQTLLAVKRAHNTLKP